MKQLIINRDLAKQVMEASTQEELAAAMDALNNTFKALIGFMPAHLLRGDKPDADIFDAARDALQTLKRHADAQNIDFPMPEDERAFRMYIIDYGREVLFR